MTWYAMVTVWYGLVWYGFVRYFMVVYGMVCFLWYLFRFIRQWYGMTWYAMFSVWCGVVFCPVQVLPGRTHPLNNMSSCGGYVLTGIKVINNPDPRGVLPGARAPDVAKARRKKRYRRN